MSGFSSNGESARLRRRSSADVAKARVARSTRSAHLAAGLIVAATLAAIPLLLPSAADLGSHLATEQGGPEALPYLERALRQSGPEREIVMPLARAYSQQGRHDAALALLRQLASMEANPAVARMRQTALLGAGRSWAYVRELEQVRRARATPDLLRELATRYGEQRLVELQIDALEQLLSMTPDDVALARKLAWLAVESGDKQRALVLLRRLWARRPGDFQPSDFGLLARLTIELDPSDAASRLIASHGADFGGPTERVDLAMHMYAVGRLVEARRLLDPLVEVARPEPTVLIAWTRCLVALGEGEVAFGKLRDLAEAGRSSSAIAGSANWPWRGTTPKQRCWWPPRLATRHWTKPLSCASAGPPPVWQIAAICV